MEDLDKIMLLMLSRPEILDLTQDDLTQMVGVLLEKPEMLCLSQDDLDRLIVLLLDYPWLLDLPPFLRDLGLRFMYGDITCPSEANEYYGSSTYGLCQTDDDCYISGCNSEICQSKAEKPLASICVVPDKPTPKQLGYQCECQAKKCQWSK
jgi:eight-cysteine-cluster-containing protein